MYVVLDNGLPTFIAVLAGLVTGAACGLLNGAIIAKSKCIPLVITLGTSKMFYGIALTVSGGRIMNFGGALNGLKTKYFEIFSPMLLVLLAMVMVAYLMMTYTKFGRRVVALGGNEKNAFLSGIMDGLDDPGDYIASVACEYDKIGEAAIKWIAEQDPEAKIFFCAGQEGAGVYEKYQEGVDRALEELGGDVKVVATLHADWLTDKAYNVTTDLINSGTEFNYIFANNDMMAQGCYNALKDAGKENIPIVSTGGSPDGFKMLQDGIEAANMTAPVSIQGVKTFMNLYNKVALGEDPAEKFTALPVIPVSADDTSSYIAWDDYAAAYKYLGENK